jgi:hypothetical protein
LRALPFAVLGEQRGPCGEVAAVQRSAVFDEQALDRAFVFHAAQAGVDAGGIASGGGCNCGCWRQRRECEQGSECEGSAHGNLRWQHAR